MERPSNKYSAPLKILAVGALGILMPAAFVRSVWEGRKLRRFHEDRTELRKAAEDYRAFTGSYPTTEEGFEVMISRRPDSSPEWKQTLRMVPIDAWGNDYRYRLTRHEGKNVPEIYSCGKDGVPDTEDDLSSLRD